MAKEGRHMTKQEFLQQLEQLLWDLPEEERLDAIWYYEDYFADAGAENEQRVLHELKSPELVADNIRAGYFERVSAEAENMPNVAADAAGAAEPEKAQGRENIAGEGAPGGSGGFGGAGGGGGGAPGGNSVVRAGGGGGAAG